MTNHKYLPLLTCVFVTTLIVSNIIAVKLVNIGGLFLPGGVILFPLTYLLGDVLTEIYGLKSARRVIWTGFFCNLLAVGAIFLTGSLSAAPFWKDQSAWDVILGSTPRLLAASFLAYLAGQFVNAQIMALLKKVTKGKLLWVRTIGSTLVGEGIDSAIFIFVAFWGVFPVDAVVQAILSQWAVKVVWEVVATPFTYWVVGQLRKRESAPV